jgi:hypothetical protein
MKQNDLIWLVVGAGVLYYLYQQSQNAANIPNATSVTALANQLTSQVPIGAPMINVAGS